MKCEKRHKKLVKNEYENNNKNRCKNTKQNVDKNKKIEQNINKNINQKKLTGYFGRKINDSKLIISQSITKKVMQSGITMIALIITIIILLILAGVTINMATSGSGIFGRAKNAANIYRESVAEENKALDDYGSAIEKADRIADGVYNEEQKVNAPVLKQGMTPVKFEVDEKDTSKMKTVETAADDKEWYNYKNKQWANAKTEDGSLWVWIPRYAYRIIPPKDDDAERKGTTEIVFLTGLTDSYVDEQGKTHTDTKRCKTEEDVIDTTTGYTVHPAFTDESKINFRNGGWDSELYGIWVAKFEAAYATSSNVSANKVNVSSGINYTQTQVWAPVAVVQTENPSATSNGWAKARNYVDGAYGSKTTTIKYPTFQGSSYSMNYINHNDAFLVAQKMTAPHNIYGLSANDTDSHMMKNSEWGAVAYLSKSQYGLDSQDIMVNIKNFDDNANNVYAGTGYNNQGKEWNDTSITETNSSSTTGNIYGIYDMSGGEWERVAAYVNNGNGNLVNYGASLITEGATSTKYVMVYTSGETSSTTTDDARSEANYNADKNKKIYGDAVHETSTSGTRKFSMV